VIQIIEQRIAQLQQDQIMAAEQERQWHARSLQAQGAIQELINLRATLLEPPVPGTDLAPAVEETLAQETNVRPDGVVSEQNN
jgi:hypothetical protein